MPLIKINNKMYSDLELKIRSIKICRTIIYNKCNKHKCSNNNLINKTKKSLNLFQTLYSCHKCNPISVSNNYFINNKLREAWCRTLMDNTEQEWWIRTKIILGDGSISVWHSINCSSATKSIWCFRKLKRFCTTK